MATFQTGGGVWVAGVRATVDLDPSGFTQNANLLKQEAIRTGKEIGKGLAEEAAKQLPKVEQGLKDTEKAAESTGTSIKRMVVDLGLAAAAAKISQAGLAFMRESVTLAAEAERVEAGYRFIWGEGAADTMTQLRAAAHGTIDDMQLMLAANQASLLGVTRNTEDMVALMAIAAERGGAMGLSTQQAFSDIVRGVGRQSRLILDNLGFMVDLGEANQKYAQSLGITVEAMTEAQKVQALLNNVLEQAGEAGGYVETTASKIDRLKTAWTNLKTTFGGVLTAGDSPIAGVMDWASEALDSIVNTNRQVREQRQLLGEYEAQLKSMKDTGQITSQQYRQMYSDLLDLYWAANWTSVTTRELEGRLEALMPPLATLDDLISVMNRDVADSQAVMGLTYLEMAHLEDASRKLIDQVAKGNMTVAEAAMAWSALVPELVEARMQQEAAAYSAGLLADAYAEAMIPTKELGFAQMESAQRYEVLQKRMDAAIGVTEDMSEAQAEARRTTHYAILGIRQYSESLTDLDGILIDSNGNILEHGKNIGHLSDQYRDAAQAADELAASIARAWAVGVDFWDDLGMAVGPWGDIKPTVSPPSLLYRELEAEDTVDAARSLSTSYEDATRELRSLVESVLQPTSVTEWDMMETRLGSYADKWDEYIRRLRAAEQGSPEWQHLIPTDVLAQGTDAIRLYVREQERLFTTGQWDQLGTGFDPDQAIDSLLDQMVRSAEETAGRENLIARVMEAAAADPRLAHLDLGRVEVASMLNLEGVQSSEEVAGQVVSQVQTGLAAADVGGAIVTSLERSLANKSAQLRLVGTSVGETIVAGMQAAVDQSAIDLSGYVTVYADTSAYDATQAVQPALTEMQVDPTFGVGVAQSLRDGLRETDMATVMVDTLRQQIATQQADIEQLGEKVGRALEKGALAGISDGTARAVAEKLLGVFVQVLDEQQPSRRRDE